MYFSGTKCSFLLFCCALSLSVVAKDTKPTMGAQGLKKPLCFVENKGQITDLNHKERTDIQYNLSAPGLNLYLGNGQLHYQFKKTEGDKTNARATTYRMDMTLVGANSHAKAQALEPHAYGERYYFPQFGNDGLEVASYDKVVYKDVYPNIDWVVYVKNNQVEYDFVVREGGNVNDIKLKYDGAAKLNITADGSLCATTPMGTIEEKTPYTYENTTGKAVASNFKLHNNVVSFETGKHTGAITIDPYLQWSTYFGGTGEDVATAVTQVSSGVSFVGGYSSSTGLATGTGIFQPTNFGVTYDAFLAQYSAAGVLTHCTYFGGTGTNTQGMGVAVDNSGANVYLAGYTTSAGLGSGASIHQASNGGLNDAFVIKLGVVTGSRVWSTYFGGSNDDYAYGITVDGSNNVYIAGQTASTSAIATPGAYQTTLSGTNDGFLARLSTAGALVWSTYYGGTAQDEAQGVACDASGNVVITGQTNSVINIASAGAYQTSLQGTNDAFVAKFTSAGTRTWATYFGGPSTEQANGVVCNPVTGDIAIAGFTTSNANVASTYAAQPAIGGLQDAFVADFTSGGARAWSTYLGGTSLDYGQGICLDQFHNVVVVGGTFSNTGISTTDGFQPNIAGDYDAFVAKYTPYGQKLWGSYFGGVLYDYANAVSCSPTDNIILAGYTTSTSGVATAGAQQTTNAGGAYDAFVTKFKTDTLVTIDQPFTDTLVCAGSNVDISYTANFNFQSDNTFTVQLSDASGSFASPTVIGAVAATGTGVITCAIPVTTTGTGYKIRIIASDPAFVSPDDLYNIDIVTSLPATVASGTTPVCEGGTISLFDTASYIIQAYLWLGPNGFSSNLQNPSIAGADAVNAGTYTVTTSHNGCPDNSSVVSITVNTFIPTAPTDSAAIACLGGTISLFANPDTTAAVTYNWTGPAGFTSTLQNPTIPDANPANQGYYFVMDTLGACASASSFIYVTVNDVTPATIAITANPGDTICKNAEVTFTASSTNGGLTPGYQWMDGSAPIVGAIAPTFSSYDLVNGTSIYCVLTSSLVCPAALNVNSNVITMTVIDNTPLAHITATTDSFIASGETVTFSSAVLNPGTLPYYEWVVNGVPVTSLTSSILTLAGITSNDTVTLILHTSNTCASPDSAISNTVVVQPSLAVPTVSALNNITLFPNPNNGGFNLKGNIAGLNANSVSLEIVNPLGQIIYKENAATQNGELDKNIDLSNIADGVYTLHMSANGQSNNIRFTIAR